MSIVAASPWIEFSFWLGGIIPSIYFADDLKYLVLVILTQRLPLIWVILAVFRLNITLLLPQVFFVLYDSMPSDCLSSGLEFFTNYVYNVMHP